MQQDYMDRNESVTSQPSNTGAVQQFLKNWLPSRGNVLFTLLVFCGLLWAQNAGAVSTVAPVAQTSSSSIIPYQGRLADTNGVPLTGTYNMIFRLYNQSSGGAPLWEEQWLGSNGVHVNDGLFNVMLGNLTSLPQNTVSSSNTLFLGIAIGTDSEMTPRIQLGSAPFAMQALSVPSGSITTEKIANGAITADKLSSAVAATIGKASLQDYAGVSYTAEVTVNNSQLQAVSGFGNTVTVAKRSKILVIASASLVYVSGTRTDLYARLRRNGQQFFQFEARHAPSLTDWSQWQWNVVDTVDPGTYTYQVYVSSTSGSGMKIKWHHPYISILVIPLE